MSLLSLPTEIKLAIVDLLDIKDITSFSLTSGACYRYCVAALYRNITLSSHSSLCEFLDKVPQQHWQHIRNLDVCNDGRTQAEHRSLALETLLCASPRLENLVLRLSGSPNPSIISCFSEMRALKSLHIKNVCEEQEAPLSERVVVSIAATVPALESLVLDRISRSKIHAPELVGAYPHIPLVNNDSDVPPHPVLGEALSLPSLLSIPSLTRLTIRDTHLGDPLWTSTPALCHLRTLDIGAFHLESDSFNRTCTERILAAVGPSISEFSLATPLSSTSKQNLKQLRKLHISSDVVVDDLVSTVSALSNSPVEDLSLHCFENDIVDVFDALEEILAVRVERGSDFYGQLQTIDIRITPSDDCYDDCDREDNDDARQKLQEFCRDVKIQSAVSCGWI